MAKTLYLKISFSELNHCFLKIFSFRDFLKPPFFLKREFLISEHIIEIHAIKPSVFQFSA